MRAARTLRLILTIVFGIAPAICGSAAANAAACRINEPEFDAGGPGLAVAVTIACGGSPAEGFVEYPDGPLFLGMSLFEAGSENGIAHVRAEGGEHFVEPATLPSVPTSEPVVLRIPTVPAGATHFAVALWAKKSPCVFAGSDVCFGPFDRDLFPIPVDTFPRPVCDVEQLQAIDFFSWAESGDPSGFQAPDEIRDVFEEIDCFRAGQSNHGLGLSLKSWNTAPMPPRLPTNGQ